MQCFTSIFNFYISEHHETLHIFLTKISNIRPIASKTSLSEIASIIGCDKSTVSREIKRNRIKRDYPPKQAHISNRKDITEHPEIIEERKRIGDYEGDTVVSKGHRCSSHTG